MLLAERWSRELDERTTPSLPGLECIAGFMKAGLHQAGLGESLPLMQEPVNRIAASLRRWLASAATKYLQAESGTHGTEEVL